MYRQARAALQPAVPSPLSLLSNLPGVAEPGCGAACRTVAQLHGEAANSAEGTGLNMWVPALQWRLRGSCSRVCAEGLTSGELTLHLAWQDIPGEMREEFLPGPPSSFCTNPKAVPNRYSQSVNNYFNLVCFYLRRFADVSCCP